MGEQVTAEMPTELFQCGAVATGLMAINLKRLTAMMAPPYFTYGTLGTKFQGEDVGFCLRARPLGLEVWCDPTINVLHMGEFPYGIPQLGASYGGADRPK
jgi:hypothetical protein